MKPHKITTKHKIVIQLLTLYAQEQQ
jgi:hypothetical protein